MIDFGSLGWPPSRADVLRLADYDRREQLYESRHAEAFAHKSDKLPPGLQSKTYLIQDYPRLVTRVCADLLFSEPPILSLSGQQDELEQMVEENNLHALFYEGAVSQSFRGDLVFRLRIGPGDDGKKRIFVEEVPAYSYFVELDPDNVRVVLSQAIAWKRETDAGTFIRVEHHTAGKIMHELFRLDTMSLSGRLERVPLELLYPGQPEEEPTGIDEPLVLHIPNDRHGSAFWGASDYTLSFESLVDEANARMSAISRVLDKHADPKLRLPEEFAPKNGVFRADEHEYFAVPPEYQNMPSYLTWDGQLFAAFKQFEVVADQIFKFTEVSPAVFGEDKAGSIESAKAMRLRFTRTLSKISGKRRYWTPGIKTLVRRWQKLKQRFFGGPVPNPKPVAIDWRDGLPHDQGDQVNTESVALTAKITSRMRAIQRAYQMTETEAIEEIARIDKETPEAPVPDPAPAPGAPADMPTHAESDPPSPPVGQ